MIIICYLNLYNYLKERPTLRFGIKTSFSSNSIINCLG